jgi:hypothetical protein
MAILALGVAGLIGAIAGRTQYELEEIEIPARTPQTINLHNLTDVEALAARVQEEEIIWAGFREVVDEILPALQAEAAAVAADTSERDCPQDVQHSDEKEMMQ